MCNHNNFATHTLPNGKVIAICGTCNANWYINVNEEQAKMAVWNTKPALPKIIKSIKLFCNNGSHDKVYNIYLELDEIGGYQVWAEYGKRNSNLKRVDKDCSTDKWWMEKAFSELVAEKKAKGYKEVEAPPKHVKSLKSNTQLATVTLDLSSPEGKQLYMALLGQSDILSKENPIPDPKNLSLTPMKVGRKFRDE